MKTESEYVKATKDKIDVFLRGKGFVKSPNVETYEGEVYESWGRKLTWRTEEVRVIYLEKDPYLVEVDIGIGLQINNETIQISGTPIDHLAGRKYGYRFPILFPRWRLTSFTELVLRDLEKSMSWYESYNTPEKCIEMIEVGKTNIGGPGGENYIKALEYLRSL